MHSLAIAFTALASLSTLISSAPTPQDAGASEPPFQVLTCQAQSIKVKTAWNTAFVTTDSAFTHYGEAEQVVPLNGCADLYATFEAFYAEAAEDAPSPPNSSVNCTIAGAPWGPDAELHIVTYNPWFELVNGDGVTVTCGEQNPQPEQPEQGGAQGAEEGEGQDGQEDQAEGEWTEASQ